MEHLVESHLGGYYVSSCDPEMIESYCEECGDHDRIIISSDDGEMFNALIEYFSDIKMPIEQLNKNNFDSKEELIDILTWRYDVDRCLICDLENGKDISPEEKTKLLKQVTLSQKKQFELVKKVYYPNGFVRRKIK